MALSVRLYAVCRERAGVDRVSIALPPQGTTVAGLLALIAQATPVLAPLLPLVRVAVNQEMARADDPVKETDEVALIPPVSGGSGQGPFGVTADKIDVAMVERIVANPRAGAIITFAGTVRDRTGEHDVVALEYEAYAEMAERFLRRIGEEIDARWPGTRTAILHRIGRLVVGETSVVIAVASPHRAQAFDACRYAIERLKQDVPIWKKEVRTDGTIWVGVGS
jgi:MoaE-MoaD fusion protein